MYYRDKDGRISGPITPESVQAGWNVLTSWIGCLVGWGLSVAAIIGILLGISNIVTGHFALSKDLVFKLIRQYCQYTYNAYTTYCYSCSFWGSLHNSAKTIPSILSSTVRIRIFLRERTWQKGCTCRTYPGNFWSPWFAFCYCWNYYLDHRAPLSVTRKDGNHRTHSFPRSGCRLLSHPGDCP